jgi:hypothetical protein
MKDKSMAGLGIGTAQALGFSLFHHRLIDLQVKKQTKVIAKKDLNNCDIIFQYPKTFKKGIFLRNIT